VSPIVHGELSWLLSQALRTRRDRILVTCAGLAPDLDVLTILGGTDAFGTWHHVLTHGYVAAIAVTIAVGILARQRILSALLALVAFHLHLLCDLAGSGPGWPLVYFWPTSRHEWFWSGQWNLASWQNSLIAVIVSVLCLATAFPLRRTIVELFAPRFDREVVKALWKRFRPASPVPTFEDDVRA
jgi:hypothetical protein